MRLTLAVLLIVLALIISLVYVKTSSRGIVQVTSLEPVTVAAYYCLAVSQNSTQKYANCIKMMLLSEGLSLARSVTVIYYRCKFVTRGFNFNGTNCTGIIRVNYSSFSRVIRETVYMNVSMVELGGGKYLFIIDEDKVPVLLQVKTEPQITCLCHVINMTSSHFGVRVYLICQVVGSKQVEKFIISDERGLTATISISG